MMCGRRDLNPHGPFGPPGPKPGASAGFRHARAVATIVLRHLELRQFEHDRLHFHGGEARVPEKKRARLSETDARLHVGRVCAGLWISDVRGEHTSVPVYTFPTSLLEWLRAVSTTGSAGDS